MRLKLFFFTNFISPHVIGFSERISERLGEGFELIETKDVTTERRNLGYHRLRSNGFVRAYSPSRTFDDFQGLSLEADLALYSLGSVDVEIAAQRIRQHLPTVFLSERLFKRGVLKLADPKFWWQVGRNWSWRNYDVWLLTMGAFVARDFRRTGFAPDRIRHFGYFPQQEDLPLEYLLGMKGRSKTVRLLWVGRLIDWKRPEDLILAARRLRRRQDLPPWRIDIVGDGPYMVKLSRLIKRYKLEDRVTLVGLSSQADVEARMRTADILVTTSNRREGWGAVINEGMSRACAVVATYQSGASRELIDDGHNGLLYKSGDISALVRSLTGLIEDKGERLRVGANAFATIDGCWNAAVAADRLLEWFHSGFHTKYEAGPLSS